MARRDEEEEQPKPAKAPPVDDRPAWMREEDLLYGGFFGPKVKSEREMEGALQDFALSDAKVHRYIQCRQNHLILRALCTLSRQADDVLEELRLLNEERDEPAPPTRHAGDPPPPRERTRDDVPPHRETPREPVRERDLPEEMRRHVGNRDGEPAAPPPKPPIVPDAIVERDPRESRQE